MATSVARAWTKMRAAITIAVALVIAIASVDSATADQPRTGDAVVNGRAERLTVAGHPAFALLDGGFDAPNDGKSFGVGLPDGRVAAFLHAHGLPSDVIHLSNHPLLVRSRDRMLLFDTGAGSFLGRSAGHLPASLALAGVRPDQITDIFISHAHGDHIGGLVRSDGSLSFPKAVIHLSDVESRWLRTMSDREAAAAVLPNRTILVAAISPRVRTFRLGAELLPDLVRSVRMPGHTPGHSGFLIGTGRSSVLYIGDVMHHAILSVEHPEWRSVFDSDQLEAARNRLSEVRRWIATSQLIYVVHFPFPGYGRLVTQGRLPHWQPISRSDPVR